MGFEFKAEASKDGSIEEDKITQGEVRATFEEARADANKLSAKNKTVTILRAEKVGINAGKFFLYQIVK